MADFNTLQELRSEIFHLHRQKKFEEALALIDRVRSDFPAHPARIGYWQLCFLALTGDRAGALRAFGEMLAAGRFVDSVLARTDPDLASLQGDPEFERLWARNGELAAQAEQVQPHMRITFEPATPHGAATYPLLVALHGNNASPAAQMDQWRPAAAHGWRVILPQSRQLADSDGDAWTWNDADKTFAEVRYHLSRLDDSGHLVIAGFSLGAFRALDLALRGSVEAKGFIIVAPFMPLDRVDALRDPAPASRQRGVRGVIVIGEADEPSLPGARACHALLSEMGIPVELWSYPGLGHEFPPDWNNRLIEALRFVAQT